MNGTGGDYDEHNKSLWETNTGYCHLYVKYRETKYQIKLNQ